MNQPASTITLQKLTLYPIKSCGGLNLKEMILAPEGGKIQIENQSVGDREWLFIDAEGKFITQRTLPELSLIQLKISDGVLNLEFGNQTIDLHAGYDSAERKNVIVWSTSISAALVQHPKIKILREYLGQQVDLVHFDQKARRMAKSNGESLGVQTRFTDAEPYLAVNQASLEDLNSRMKNPIQMSRFRANFEFSGAAAFAEDNWLTLQSENIKFNGTKSCSRCVMINIDQENHDEQVKKDPEALKVLASFRRKGSGVKFGQYIWTENFGQIIKVGDRFNSQPV